MPQAQTPVRGFAYKVTSSNGKTVTVFANSAHEAVMLATEAIAKATVEGFRGAVVSVDQRGEAVAWGAQP